MRIISAIFIFAFFFHLSYAQEIDFSKISFGAVVCHNVPQQGDLKKYWSSSPGYGICAYYNLSDYFAVEVGILAALFKPLSDYSHMELPKFAHIYAPLILRYEIYLLKNAEGFIGIGLSNNTFYFSGKRAEELGNNIESEFGGVVSAGVSIKFIKNFKTEAYINCNNIYSSPDEIQIISFGIKGTMP